MRPWIPILFLLQLGLAMPLLGQKGSIKSQTTGTSPQDTVKAAQGKAALRGSALMQAARDSLKNATIGPSSTVVDTFGTDSNAYSARSYLSPQQIAAAEHRLDEAYKAITEARVQLAAAEKSKKYSEQRLQAARDGLAAEEKRLDGLKLQLAQVRRDWENSRTYHHSGSKADPAGPADMPK